MRKAVFHDSDGNIISTSKFADRKGAPTPKPGEIMTVFPEGDIHAENLHSGRQKMNPDWDGRDTSKAFIDRELTDYEKLKQDWHVKRVVAIAHDPVEWARFEAEIKSFEVGPDGKIQKKAEQEPLGR